MTEKALLMSAVFFNSTNEHGPTLSAYQQAAEEQNAKVLRIMRAAGKPMTPWEVWEAGCTGTPCDWLIGSVRRSMTVLSIGMDAPLVPLETKRMGPRGRMCYEWALLHPAVSRQTETTNEQG